MFSTNASYRRRKLWWKLIHITFYRFLCVHTRYNYSIWFFLPGTSLAVGTLPRSQSSYKWWMLVRILGYWGLRWSLRRCGGGVGILYTSGLRRNASMIVAGSRHVRLPWWSKDSGYKAFTVLGVMLNLGYKLARYCDPTNQKC